MMYSKLGLKVGVEIHQQLDTKHKLFCRCPTKPGKDEKEFHRYLRLKRSEIGEEDKAAREEVERSRKFIYKYCDTTCLVEADEEPPAEVNVEALKIAVQIAKMLNMELVDEVHVMRKIVIDGSNTTGFQRTALIAFDGYIEVDERKIGIATLCLEEEACRKIEDGEGYAVYSLDRLGIPLVEISTKPEIDSPQLAKKVAAKIGMILRSTGKVKRGIGTIRQDINVSIADGARVEIKGVQELEILDKVVENEVVRQLKLLEIRNELLKRSAHVFDDIFDVTDVFSNSKSQIVKGKIVKAILLKGFGGIVGKEIQPKRRLGTEFADIAKNFGLKGIIHTDELPAYGISDEEVKKLKELLKAEENDAIVIAAGSSERVDRALRRIIERAKYCLKGVPEETRKANEDGTTSYLRPLPGAARMYPETDVPPVTLEGLEVEIPELIEDRAKRYSKDLPFDLAWEVADSPYWNLYEEYSKLLQPTVVAKVLYSIPAQLKREGIDVSQLGEEQFRKVLNAIYDGRIAKEGAEEALKILAKDPRAEISFVAVNVDEIIEKIVESKKDLIAEKGEAAFKPLMGLVMKEVRGKVDGKIVAEKLLSAIRKVINK
ncbi:MAG: Glu-tRNA(Gln) amidotransferase subunit GatE [Archaeoglobaceae archaeon]|nr:Glu-tRNA(Gln) amidotransferase subunit GatE [Archaeoglobaceae archaeon]MCX8152063.1 Glu-tRNA(Gln) amidotransferase subunit GatE [Archaeoglobaceae archaeon]MDW8013828.1 Glu-tRNA(Gln) amidotransferase subunit GatE [Archaeoglobaceae archaeon]